MTSAGAGAPTATTAAEPATTATVADSATTATVADSATTATAAEPATTATVAEPANTTTIAGSAGRRPAWSRLPLLALGFASLIVGIGAGLARLGFTVPALARDAAAWHGPLMVCGFFGVVISLERAVAVGHRWAYAAPLLAALGSAAVLAGAVTPAAALYVAASLVLLAASLDVLRRQREPFVVVLAIAAGFWTAGSLAWASGGAVHDALGGWLGFLVLTIAGERLELSRFMAPSRSAQRLFRVPVALSIVALLAWPAPWAPHLFGLALLGLAAWMMRYDIARRTVRQRGLTRFIAVCLLAGYGWLAVAGATMLLAGLPPGSRAGDAALHALLLGFVFSMVLGHAPIILPGVLRTPLPYRVRFYAPLALLHASVALRVGGDALDWRTGTRLGGLLSAVALIAFLASTAAAVLGARRSVSG